MTYANPQGRREIQMWKKWHGDGNGIACPYCGSQRFKITDSRPHRATQRRRRQCKKCNERFWTVEVLSDVSGNLSEPGVHPENYDT